MKLFSIICFLLSSILISSVAFSAENILPTKIEIKKTYETDEDFKNFRNNPNIPQIIDFSIVKCDQTGARNFIDSTGKYKRYDYKCRLILSLDNGVEYEEVLSLFRKGNSKLFVSHSFYRNDPLRHSFP
ncbi:hypothetical protein [Acinetobacter colistiniresistens]|uniref:hypothetical protein n=1 Tax=Acinetobacter colistiniresistens TaxID=280145 RepID=UPI002FE2E3F1